MAKTVKEWNTLFANDPKFAALSYEDQLNARAAAMGEALPQDPEFLALSPADRSYVYNKMVVAAPRLENRPLQDQMVSLTETAKNDPDPKKREAANRMLGSIVQTQGMISGSLIGKVVGLESQVINRLLPHVGMGFNTRDFPDETKAILANMNANPKDFAKMAMYAEEQMNPEAASTRQAKVMRTVNTVAGTLMDFALLMPLTGASSAPAGIGKLITAIPRAAAMRATTMTGKFMANVASGAAHAAATGALGVARENFQEFLNQNGENLTLQETIGKNFKWFGGYYLGDAFFNVFLDTIVPVARAAKQIFVPKGTTKQIINSLSQTDINNRLMDLLGGREFDQKTLEASGLSNLKSIRALQSQLRVLQNVENGTQEDFISMVLSHHGYNFTKEAEDIFKVQIANPALRGGQKPLESLVFKSPKAVVQWMVKEMPTPGSGVFPATGPASLTYKNFKKSFKQDAGVLEEWKVSAETQKMFAKEMGDAVNPHLSPDEVTDIKNWIHQADPKALQRFLRDVETNFDYQDALQANLKRMGFGDEVVIYKGRSIKVTDPLGRPYANGSLEKGVANQYFRATEVSPKNWITEVYIVPRRNIVGVGSVKEGELLFKTEGVLKLGDSYTNEFLSTMHRDYVKSAMEEGFVIPKEVLSEYTDLLPLHLQPLKSVEAAAGAYKAELKEMLRGTLDNPVSVDVMVRLFAPDVAGVFEKGKLQAFINHFGKSFGATKAELDSIKLVEEATASGVADLVLTTPTKVVRFSTIGEKEKDVLNAVLDAFKEVVVPKTPVAKAIRQAGSKLFSSYEKSLVKQHLFTDAWAEDVATKAGWKIDPPTEGRNFYVLHDGSGTWSHSGNMDVIKKELILRSVDDGYFKAFLAEEGYTLRQTKEGEYLVLKPGEIEPMARGDSVQAILREHPELMPKMPSDIGPQLAVIVPGKRVEVAWKKGVAMGSYKDILEVLDSYRSKTLQNTKVSLHASKKGQIIANKVSKQLEVYVADVGYRKHFTKVEDAQAYLKGGYESLSEMTQIASTKGYLLKPEAGKWILWNNGMSVVVDDLEGVKKVLRDVPIPEWAPELSGLTEDSLVGLIQPPVGSFQPQTWVDQTATPGWWDTIRQYVKSVPDFMENWVKKGGDPKLLELFRTLQSGRQITAAADHEAAVVLKGIMSPGGKLISEERRIYIGEWLKAKNKDVVATARKLTTEEVRAGEQYRTLWDGLGKKYSVDPRLLLEDYFPRLEKYHLANQMRMYGDGEVERVLKDAFGPTPPRELDAFFKHRRVSEVMGVAMENDPMKAAMRYIGIGNRQLILGPDWKKALDYIQHGTTDPILATSLKRYMNDVMGLPQTGTEATMRMASLQMLKKMGATDADSHDILKQLMTLGYTSALGFNPFKAVRNYLDMFVTVAPRLGSEGNTWISKAAHNINLDRGAIFERARARGVITSGMPVSGGEQLVETGFSGKVLNLGMGMYKNSDDLSRVIAFHAAELRWDDAVRRYEAGLSGAGKKMSQGSFEEMSGLDTMPGDIANKARMMVSEKKWDVAKDIYATNLVTEALFPFRSGLSPTSMRGVVGKLFGMMGHYPIYYIENVKRALTQGSTASKLAFAGTFLANSAILYTGLQSVGINGQDYLPWNPVRFSGGPYYQMMNQALLMLNRGYQGRQARADLLGIGTENGKVTFHPSKGNLFKWSMPGGFEIMKIQKAFELQDAGDDWGAFLSATGATPTTPWAWQAEGMTGMTGQ